MVTFLIMVNLVHCVLNLVKSIKETRGYNEMNRFDFCYSIESLKNRVKTEKSKKALDIADHLSDLILFHKMVRENGTEMMKPFKRY